MTALLRSSTPVRFLMHPNLIGERSPHWLAHFRLTNPVNGHDLGNHCPTPAVTSAVPTSNSNCLPRLTLSHLQINALMPNSILLRVSCGWPVPVRGQLVITTNSHDYKPLFPDPGQSMGHRKPFRDVRERHESTSAAASTLFQVAS